MIHTASYRIQLREGVDFDTIVSRLDHIAGLGVSHLYLAPILTAAPGSTHGYDVTDPTTIDESLGGREGFERLNAEAKARGLAIILDIVPNHMAFGLDTPWLVDVLRHGEKSEHARTFDIDWQAGPLALPWLTDPLPVLAERGEVSVEDDALVVGDLRIPLAPGSAMGNGTLDETAATALHEAQSWRLLPWQMERDSITHRRFFSVTGLVGVRIEDPEIFERTHATVLDLARSDLIQGLRVDHVDGLVDPGGYLRRLREALPESVPVWIEKILVDGEALRDWPIAGSTGYDAATIIARLLTEPAGMERIDTLWREASGIEGDFHPFVEEAKREILTDELAAELRQLIGLAERAAEEDGFMAGPEMLREALTELLTAFPQYRSYIGDTGADIDRALWEDSAVRAAEHVRSADVIDWIVARILASDTNASRALAVRIEQVTGALIAKAHEDTAGFRFNRYLAANEVGAEPGHPLPRAGEVQSFLDERMARFPHALNLGSSHDTKRSEDARARIAAMTHAPYAVAELWERALAGDEQLEPNRLFYAFQVALALWDEPEAHDRVADHLVKALREGKEVSYWTAPDEEREARMQDWVRRLLADWDARRPDGLERLVRIGAALSLRELALRCTLPGMPDIYQGGEGMLLQLTDPDNRRAPDWDMLASLPRGDDPSSEKFRLLTTLLELRNTHPDLFSNGEALWDDETRRLTRRHGDTVLTVTLGNADGTGNTVWEGGSDEIRTVIRLKTPA
ncbi:malto-oligosyltrehalose synthase [Palleronia sp. LCG004]|uniref:malto-oligosyltrehalose synthase n=1 Tax=Palleronia sp. LCG004 TaxID=3079304 RepID=UPI002942D4FD|nr:malto-oligosyltrehalose synthase [Palleronia sp. LCG004]WOI56445.1 malto-oligosyltrehalose synthase [Palleronia sp. LCG004]